MSLDLNATFDQLVAREGGEFLAGIREGLRLLMETLLEAQLLRLRNDREDLPLPDEVHEVIERYRPIVDAWVLPKLDKYSQMPSFELFQSRAFIVDLEGVSRAEEKKSHWLFTPSRTPGQRNPSASAIREDIKEVLQRNSDQEAFAVWVAALPAPLDILYPGEYLAFAYVLDRGGQEACLVATDAHVVWLPFTGDDLTEVLNAVVVLGNGPRMAHINNKVTDALNSATVMALSTSATLSAPLLDKEKASAVAERLWQGGSALNQVLDMALTEFSYDSMCAQDELMAALTRAAMEFLRRLKQNQAEAEAQAEKAAKRLRKDQERMQMAYDGLKARAARQDVTIRQLQSEVRQLRAASASPGAGKSGNAQSRTALTASSSQENESFDAGLAHLFGMGA